jgi:CBS domain-containing protein
MKVRDLMNAEVATVRRNVQLQIADDLMSLGRIRHTPVLEDDGEGVVGVLSQRDLFRGALARALGYGQRAQNKMLGLLFVKDVMTCDPITVAPDLALAEAANIMLDKKIGCLPVVEDGRLVGILTESDFLRLALRA